VEENNNNKQKEKEDERRKETNFSSIALNPSIHDPCSRLRNYIVAF
jgi:hypothetical protein